MAEDNKAKNFITTKYRVRPGVQTLIKYIEWKDLSKDEERYDKHKIDTIVRKNLSLIKEGKVTFIRDTYRTRKDVSITLDKNTIQEIHESYKSYKCYKGELIEICLYIYAIEHLAQDEILRNHLDLWNIKIQFH
jgi:hypothetical protein